jgi:hypothetical protein
MNLRQVAGSCNGTTAWQPWSGRTRRRGQRVAPTLRLRPRTDHRGRRVMPSDLTDDKVGTPESSRPRAARYSGCVERTAAPTAPNHPRSASNVTSSRRSSGVNSRDSSSGSGPHSQASTTFLPRRLVALRGRPLGAPQHDSNPHRPTHRRITVPDPRDDTPIATSRNRLQPRATELTADESPAERTTHD